jgi:hypothetical protein
MSGRVLFRVTFQLNEFYLIALLGQQTVSLQWVAMLCEKMAAHFYSSSKNTFQLLGLMLLNTSSKSLIFHSTNTPFRCPQLHGLKNEDLHTYRFDNVSRFASTRCLILSRSAPICCCSFRVLSFRNFSKATSI